MPKRAEVIPEYGVTVGQARPAIIRYSLSVLAEKRNISRALKLRCEGEPQSVVCIPNLAHGEEGFQVIRSLIE